MQVIQSFVWFNVRRECVAISLYLTVVASYYCAAPNFGSVCVAAVPRKRRLMLNWLHNTKGLWNLFFRCQLTSSLYSVAWATLNAFNGWCSTRAGPSGWTGQRAGKWTLSPILCPPYTLKTRYFCRLNSLDRFLNRSIKFPINSWLKFFAN